MRRTYSYVNCLRCGKEFKARAWQLKMGWGKYCSHSCSFKGNAIQLGKVPWNKGKRGLYPAWNKGLKGFGKGKANGMWKGNKVGMVALHSWVKRQLGFPTKCEHCGKDGLTGRYIDWANKSGKYLRDISDWLRLCRSCHKYYDLAMAKTITDTNLR